MVVMINAHRNVSALCGVVWCGVVWCGVVWCGVVWCGVVWCGVVWCGVVWRGVVWCGVVWCGVVKCGVVYNCAEVLVEVVIVMGEKKKVELRREADIGNNLGGEKWKASVGCG